MSEYSEDFEKDENQDIKTSEDEHLLRMSIELHSVKDLVDSYMLYSKFTYKLLGTRRTQPVLVRKTVENRIDNAFQANEFVMTKSDLYAFLASNHLSIELWHNDKYTKDQLIGTADFDMEQVLRAPLKKTKNSMVRVLDTWCEITDDNASLIGSIRAVIYLEDLGEKKQGAVLAQSESPEDYKAVWELELWKRAEESKWNASLKDKEQEYISKLAIDWQEAENQRDFTFQKLTAEVTNLENKLRSKAIELMKREKNIVKLEEAKKLKYNESIRIMALKEEEIIGLKAKINEVSMKASKENKSAEKNLEKIRQEISVAEEKLRVLKREQDFESISRIRLEIDSLSTKNITLKKEVETFTQQTRGFKINCENVRNEFVTILSDFEQEKKNWEIKETEKIGLLEAELEKIKSEAIAFRLSQEKAMSVRCSCNQWKETEQERKPIENPEVKRLREEIDSLIGSGMYNEEDAIIIELSKQIKMLTV